MVDRAVRRREVAAGEVVRGRRFEGEVDGEEATTAAAAAGCGCRACAAAAVADCIALGCCPCAVVSLLGLALVRAPLAAARRCAGWVRRRRRRLLHKKRVRDVAAAAATAAAAIDKAEADAGELAAGAGDEELEEVELAWLEQMYQMGHWGFGRVSFSEKNP